MPDQRAGRLVDRLSAIALAKRRRIVGLMSGTSHDGVDAALVDVSGSGASLKVDVVRFECFPFEPELRSRIASARDATTLELARLDFDIGEAFASAALRVILASGAAPVDVALIGSHGQTVFHDPPSEGRNGVTLQIGEADVIARRTGIVTVSDFRTADVAAGGSGAPLIPMVDWLLFRKPGSVRLMLNVGGIANVTRVGEDPSTLIAFDTGPGNALLDEIMRMSTNGRETFDRDGARGSSGTASDGAADRFLEHPYFARRPPKSTGKELFGAQEARRLAEMMYATAAIEDLGEDQVRDLLATAALVTARAVRDGAARFAPGVSEVVVSGGGVRNSAIMRELSLLFSPVPVRNLDSLGMDPDAKEAVGFAVLASETIMGEACNVPAATGAEIPVVLGKISPAL